MNPKALQFKVNDSVRNIWSREKCVIDSVMKPDSSTYKIKGSNGEKIIESFYEE